MSMRRAVALPADPTNVSLPDTSAVSKVSSSRSSAKQDLIEEHDSGTAELFLNSPVEIGIEKGQGRTEKQENNDDDDPDKLWCICRKPHGNRFMISCDKCRDWFHGTCVNVTPTRGRKLELTGKPWHCPLCEVVMIDKKKQKQAQQKPKQRKGKVGGGESEQTLKLILKKVDEEQSQRPSISQPKKITPMTTQEQSATITMAPKRISPAELKQAKLIAITATAAPKASADAEVSTGISVEPRRKIAANMVLTDGRPKRKIKKSEQEALGWPCRVCTKPARNGFIYCSDLCRQKDSLAKTSRASPTLTTVEPTSAVEKSPESKGPAQLKVTFEICNKPFYKQKFFLQNFMRHRNFPLFIFRAPKAKGIWDLV